MGKIYLEKTRSKLNMLPIFLDNKIDAANIRIYPHSWGKMISFLIPQDKELCQENAIVIDTPPDHYQIGKGNEYSKKISLS